MPCVVFCQLQTRVVGWRFSGNRRFDRLWCLTLGAEIVDQVFYLIGLERVSEWRHASATFANLALDAVGLPSLADGKKFRPPIGTGTINTMAVLATLVVEGYGSRLPGLF